MSILQLTSFDQIRGVLAVSPSDLPDEVLEPLVLEDDLSDDLSDWLPSWESLRDGDSQQESRALRLYAKYRCAAWVAVSAQNFILTQFTDGANAGQRSDREGFSHLKGHLEERAQRYQDKLLELTSPGDNAAATPVMSAVTPSRDPVAEGRDDVS